MKQTTEKLCLSELTAQEARTALADNPVIILPLGSHEDQGPHAPMGDYLCADAIARRVALATRARGIGTYVAPVLPRGGLFRQRHRRNCTGPGNVTCRPDRYHVMPAA